MRSLTSPQHRARAGAVKLGIPLGAYLAKIAAGLKRCYACKDWHPVEAFGARSGRPDGLDNLCREQRNARSAEYMRRLHARRRQERGVA